MNSNLHLHINQFPRLKVLVVGDIMLDLFVYGHVERIAPEAPVPVLNVNREVQTLGGAANVAANIQALGCSTMLVGLLGPGPYGKKIKELLDQKGVSYQTLMPPDYLTTTKIRYMTADNHYYLRVDREVVSPDLSSIEQEFSSLIKEQVSQADIVILSDYSKGLLTHHTSREIINTCQEMGKPVVVDPKGTDYSKYEGATLVKPNLKEFAAVTGCTALQEEEAGFEEMLKTHACKLMDQHKLDYLLVTMGKAGMRLLDRKSGDCIHRVSSKARKVGNVSGAGDTAIAALGAAMGAKAPLPEAVELANWAASLAVEKSDTATITSHELFSVLQSSVLNHK